MEALQNIEIFGGLIQNTQDLLNISLSIAAIFLTLFLSLVLVRLFRVLGTLNSLMEDAQDILELVQNYLWQPARIMMAIKEKFSGIISLFTNFFSEKKK